MRVVALVNAFKGASTLTISNLEIEAMITQHEDQ
jgi:hypothetical protein